MNQQQNFIMGTPVKMYCKDKTNKPKHIFGKVLCSNLKDDNFYSCITPHGSIIKTHFSNIHELKDITELSTLKKLEKKASDLHNIIYNNIFNSHFNNGKN